MSKLIQPVILGEIEEWIRTLLEPNDPRTTNSSAIPSWNQDKWSDRNNHLARQRPLTYPAASSVPDSSPRSSTLDQRHSASDTVIFPANISLTSRSNTIVASPEDCSIGGWKVPSTATFQPSKGRTHIIPGDSASSSLPTCLDSSPDLNIIRSTTTSQEPTSVSAIPNAVVGLTRGNSTSGIIDLPDDFDFDIIGKQPTKLSNYPILSAIASNPPSASPSTMISSTISKSQSLLSSLTNQLNLIKYQIIDNSNSNSNKESGSSNIDVDRSIRTVYELTRLIDDIKYFNELNHFNESISPSQSSLIAKRRNKSPFPELSQFDEALLEKADNRDDVPTNQSNFDFGQGVREELELDASSVETISSSSPVDGTSISQSIPPPLSSKRAKKQTTMIRNGTDESSHANDNADISRKRRRLYLPRSDQWLETNDNG